MALISESTKIAAEIDSICVQTLQFISAQATQVWRLVNTPGLEQEILDNLGENGVKGLGIYNALFEALQSLGVADGLNSPDLAVFQPQPDGSLLFVPQVEEEEPIEDYDVEEEEPIEDE